LRTTRPGAIARESERSSKKDVPMLPPWPGWDALHPLVIHFPIALLLVAPIFVALAALRPGRGTPFAISALVLLVLGTTAAFVAVETGEAAAEVATRSEAINVALERHATLAEVARNLFAGLTALYAIILVAPRLLASLKKPAYVAVMHLVFLALLLAGDLVLANVAHRGGLLVHKYGVHAMLPPGF
jgi:uncharacterized membrane protein